MFARIHSNYSLMYMFLAEPDRLQVIFPIVLKEPGRIDDYTQIGPFLLNTINPAENFSKIFLDFSSGCCFLVFSFNYLRGRGVLQSLLRSYGGYPIRPYKPKQMIVVPPIFCVAHTGRDDYRCRGNLSTGAGSNLISARQLPYVSFSILLFRFIKANWVSPIRTYDNH